MRIDLSRYDRIVVNTSAGKDSQAMTDLMVELADAAGVRDRLVMLHCDLGLSPGGEPIEWPGTLELAQEHAEHYGLRFIVVRRGTRGFMEQIERLEHWPRASTRNCTSTFKRDQGQKVVNRLALEVIEKSKGPGFLEMIEERGMFPDQKNRLCTSSGKRDPANTAITALADEFREDMGKSYRPHILQCFGFRAQESSRRRKMETFSTDKRTSNSRKEVNVWLPIHSWKVEDVWARIKAAGTRPHPAYAMGMSRLSCRFCIFAPRSQLILSARLNPKLFEEYLALEKRIGHRFKDKLSLADIKAAVDAGETGAEASPDDGCWNM
jgi:3'-phosphoadenosine 5'-phosphosulfate sulfotransferase (PAPS reductase)/FAD synthetase